MEWPGFRVPMAPFLLWDYSREAYGTQQAEGSRMASCRYSTYLDSPIYCDFTAEEAEADEKRVWSEASRQASSIGSQKHHLCG